ncbi:leucine-rich repeat, immunoglobulin-like domain and transmembrane domain-containing protein 1 [Protopterus annectens]|uniref:leucine-rich repeat, immunoglobulin-like domain and transmembrane domain-containing protein 1 n=1 Tax=Protopterus annectens TaxID=7888 RepID=UPI001CFC18A7|nr:leucine-rich repeat, immunoglobulin-like domain and transmembrane domain-containing protein 1 [Protopterus annectens]
MVLEWKGTSSTLRSVLCNDPDMTLIPVNIPGDTSKLQIEKTSVKRLPGEAFHYLQNLEYLWMSCNSLTILSSDSLLGLYAMIELRLDGNLLTSFPWEALADVPKLRLLNLHNNKLPSIPAEAAFYLRNITFLDLSSNKLMTLPTELFIAWQNFQPVSKPFTENSKLILGLQDNPWNCDCRLYELAYFLKLHLPFVALIEPRLRCLTPPSLTGALFSQVELRRCQSPVVYTSVTKLKTSLGSTVLLRCGTTGVPIPELSWRRADGQQLNGTVHQEISGDGMRWSVLGLPAVSYIDSGEYICKAKNFLGTTDAYVSLIITDNLITEDPNRPLLKTTWSNGVNGLEAAAYNEKLFTQYIIPASTTSSTEVQSYQMYGNEDPESDQAGNQKKAELSNMSKSNAMPKMATVNEMHPGGYKSTLNPTSNQQEQENLIRSVKVIGDTEHSITLAWKSPYGKNTTIFNVLYAVFGERNMNKITGDPGKTIIKIEGLEPKTKYIACVCGKGLIPKKENCAIFSTDEAVTAGGTQKLINVVVISVACVIAVPLTLVVCCGALKRHCKKLLRREPKNTEDPYVTFESLSPGPIAKAAGDEEFLTSHTLEESNRLLSERSSVDSEATAKMEGQHNEYFC